MLISHSYTDFLQQALGLAVEHQQFMVTAIPSSKVLSAYFLEPGKYVGNNGHDKYIRTIGDMILPDGVSLNQELVKQRWCWWYRKYAPADRVLEGLEQDARDAKKGLWADPQPLPPWIYPKRKSRTRSIACGRQSSSIGQ